jgi:uncharacterized repeat protein (TIGR03803 family)
MTRLRMHQRLIFLSARNWKAGAKISFGLGKTVCMLALFCVATATASQAQTFTPLASFNGNNGSLPYYGSLAQGTDGNFYGMTVAGGSNDDNGVVFKITPTGGLTTVYNFCALASCSDGRLPYSGLLLASNGDFYGTASRGGDGNAGTIFEITPAGELTTLYRFCTNFYTGFCLDGEFPETPLVQGSNGNFYGSTSEGGSDVGNYGAVFEITPTGTYTKLHAFCKQTSCLDGNIPSGLVQGANGNAFFGTTSAGGLDQAGTVFEITPNGALTTLYTFCPQSDCSEGARPSAGLVQATDGNFYGTAVTGGSTECTQGCGTIFKITPEGRYSVLHSFCSESRCADGGNPFAGLIQATDGNLYGTTGDGGANGAGTIFKISLAGKLTTLYAFCSETNCTDGNSPLAALVQATDGAFYGTTPGGGKSTRCNGGCGTVYSLSVGLGPFVETVPASSDVGATVIILGNKLTGASSVSFNGTSAVFTVVSSTEITTAVPVGATTGPVEVITPGGTLKSNVAFRIAP